MENVHTGHFMNIRKENKSWEKICITCDELVDTYNYNPCKNW